MLPDIFLDRFNLYIHVVQQNLQKKYQLGRFKKEIPVNGISARITPAPNIIIRMRATSVHVSQDFLSITIVSYKRRCRNGSRRIMIVLNIVVERGYAFGRRAGVCL
jgi:hypothetical protein